MKFSHVSKTPNEPIKIITTQINNDGSYSYEFSSAKDYGLSYCGEYSYRFFALSIRLEEAVSPNHESLPTDNQNKFWLINETQLKEEKINSLFPDFVLSEQLLTLEEVKHIFDFNPEDWTADHFNQPLNIAKYTSQQLIALTHSQYEDRQLQALEALNHRLKKNTELKNALREAGIIQKLLGLLDLKHPKLRLITAMLSTLICENRLNKKMVSDAQVIPTLMYLLKNTPQDQIKINLMFLLGNLLINNKEDQNLLFSNNRMRFIVTLGFKTKDENVKESVKHIIRAFESQDAENFDRIKNLIEQIISELKNNKHNKKQSSIDKNQSSNIPLVSSCSAFKPTHKRSSPSSISKLDDNTLSTEENERDAKQRKISP